MCMEQAQLTGTHQDITLSPSLDKVHRCGFILPFPTQQMFP